jgi:8-oxo-dGTP pyrophosphatase MutT (NUDIX family)
MDREQSFGVVPFRHIEDRVEFLLVKHRAGHWGFPKGHPEGDETPPQSALRELLEETGLAAALLDAPPLEEHYVYRFKGRLRNKTVTYFVGEVAAEAEATPQEAEVSQLAWGDAEATRQRLSFKEGRRLLDRALEALSG